VSGTIKGIKPRAQNNMTTDVVSARATSAFLAHRVTAS